MILGATKYQVTRELRRESNAVRTEWWRIYFLSQVRVRVVQLTDLAIRETLALHPRAL